MWYGVGSATSGVMEGSWTGRIAPDKMLLYASALHWALTQFTPATVDLSPVNVFERFFASGIVIFAMLVFSSLISRLSSMISMQRQINASHVESQANLREFLRYRRVRVELGHRIWVF